MNTSDVEMLWIDGWSDLYELLAQDPTAEVVDDLGRALSEDQWKSLIQTRAYTAQERVFLRQSKHRGRARIELRFVPGT